MLGDSHAMGWGVEQEEALPQVLARKSGRKVLNAAVSSYGTVREMLMLDRLDTSRPPRPDRPVLGQRPAGKPHVPLGRRTTCRS